MSDYSFWDLTAAGFFAPFYPRNGLGMDHRDLGRGIFMAVLSAFVSWTVFGWLIIRRYHFQDFLLGNWESPAKVFAYENNGLFMVYMTLTMVGLTWILPSLLQIALNFGFYGKDHKDLRRSLAVHGFSAPSFGWFAFPVVIIITWMNPVDWTVGFTQTTELWIYIWVVMCLFYCFICAAFRSTQEFRLPWWASMLHLWIPITLLVLAVSLGKFF